MCFEITGMVMGFEPFPDISTDSMLSFIPIYSGIALRYWSNTIQVDIDPLILYSVQHGRLSKCLPFEASPFKLVVMSWTKSLQRFLF